MTDVPNGIFENGEKYFKTFEPLFFEECKQQLQRSKHDAMKTGFQKLWHIGGSWERGV